MRLPEGFSASGVACGLKPSGNLDLGLLVSDRPAVTAGVFTSNRVQAAPLLLARRRIRRGIARAIVVNAGNANACTGPQGMLDAEETARRTAAALGLAARDVVVASTGVIGVPMNMSAVAAGIEAASRALSARGGGRLRAAMMTTDTRPKSAEAETDRGLIVGVAKGAGMMAPEMATMLAFIATDASVVPAFLRPALRDAVGGSFNAIDLDGCRSTNDCVLVLANAARGGRPLAGGASGRRFACALGEVCESLARQIARDGEGMTKLVTIRVEGARNAREARRAAGSVAGSVLLRCALHGADPNWGRVLAALGTSGVPFDPNRVDVWLGGEQMCVGGGPGAGDRARARRAMSRRHVEIRIDLHRGAASSTVLTNDLSAEYVRINAEYTT